MLPICNVVRSFDFYHNISFVCWKHDHLDNFYLVGMRGLEFAHWTWRWWWGRLPNNCGSWWREMGEVSLSPPGQAHRQRRKHSSGLLRCIWDNNDDGVPKKNLQGSIKLLCLHLKSCSWVQLPIFKAWTTFTTPAPYTWARKFRHHPGDHLSECHKVDPSWPPFPLGWACPHGLRASPL